MKLSTIPLFVLVMGLAFAAGAQETQHPTGSCAKSRRPACPARRPAPSTNTG